MRNNKDSRAKDGNRAGDIWGTAAAVVNLFVLNLMCFVVGRAAFSYIISHPRK